MEVARGSGGRRQIGRYYGSRKIVRPHVILSRIHWDTNDPIESGDLGDSLGVILKTRQRFDQTVFDGRQAGEDKFGEPFFADFVPKRLHRI